MSKEEKENENKDISDSKRTKTLPSWLMYKPLSLQQALNTWGWLPCAKQQQTKSNNKKQKDKNISNSKAKHKVCFYE